MNTTVLLLLCMFQQGSTTPAEDPEYMQKISYILGHQMGSGLGQEEIEVSIDHIIDGLTDGLQGKSKYDEAEMRTLIRKFQEQVRSKGIERRQREGSVNAQAAMAFLAENKGREGVVTTASGLQYKIMQNGSGPKPAGPASKVKVHYHGTLLDGTVFDSTVERNSPIEFGLNRVIKGWTEGLQLMPVGSKFRFWIPPELGYGATPRPGGKIGPNALLIFDVELLEITGE